MPKTISDEARTLPRLVCVNQAVEDAAEKNAFGSLPKRATVALERPHPVKFGFARSLSI